MRLYRVFPYDANAAADHPGGALFVPAGGRGRFDNPHLYRTLYCSIEPQCAIIERLGELDTWSAEAFLQPVPTRDQPLPLALAAFDADIEIVDLADVRQLLDLGVARVTEVVARKRETTQHLAAKAFETYSQRAGLAWWSFYTPSWTNVMLWAQRELSLAGEPTVLTLSDPLVRDTAKLMHRHIA